MTRMRETCEWPGCSEPALCSSGNFLGRLVCDEHFSITNGPATPESVAAMERVAGLLGVDYVPPLEMAP